jgi:hypothetical protein
MFTVKQLIAALEDLPPDAGVAIHVDLDEPEGLYALDESAPIEEEGRLVRFQITGADRIDQIEVSDG